MYYIPTIIIDNSVIIIIIPEVSKRDLNASIRFSISTIHPTDLPDNRKSHHTPFVLNVPPCFLPFYDICKKESCRETKTTVRHGTLTRFRSNFTLTFSK